jgi:hypothetical protein
VLGGGTCECLWLVDNDVTMSMVKRAYQNFNRVQGQNSLFAFEIWCVDREIYHILHNQNLSYDSKV